MAHFRGSMAPLVRCVLLMLLGCSAAAMATGPGVADDEAIKLDQTIQALKDEATQLQRDAQVARRAFLYPPETRLAVYLSNSVSNLLLKEVQISVDGGKPTIHTYDPISSRALLVDGALQQLALTNINAGAHRLELRYSGEYGSGEATEGRFEAAFDKTLEASEIEIEIVRGSRKGPPAFRVREWKAARR